MPPPNLTNSGIAARLVQARAAAGFVTPDAAAIRLGMGTKVYIRHERGEAAVKAAELRRYASVFGVSHGWLSTGIGAGPGVPS